MQLAQGGDDRHLHVTQTCKFGEHPHGAHGALLTYQVFLEFYEKPSLYANKINVGRFQKLKNKGPDCLAFSSVYRIYSALCIRQVGWTMVGWMNLN